MAAPDGAAALGGPVILNPLIDDDVDLLDPNQSQFRTDLGNESDINLIADATPLSTVLADTNKVDEKDDGHAVTTQILENRLAERARQAIELYNSTMVQSVVKTGDTIQTWPFTPEYYPPFDEDELRGYNDATCKQIARMLDMNMDIADGLEPDTLRTLIFSHPKNAAPPLSLNLGRNGLFQPPLYLYELRALLILRI